VAVEELVAENAQALVPGLEIGLQVVALRPLVPRFQKQDPVLG
jgi:hypothetical protein